MSFRFLSFLALTILAGSTPAYALSCAQAPDWENRIPGNELIVRAKVISIEPEFYIPYIQKKEDQGQIVTFEVLGVYKGPEIVPARIEAKFSDFFMSWGPRLQVGQEGEYLFDKVESDWVYSGPGGCTVVSEKAWQQLRKAERPHK